jgi:hypothetical protein
MGLPTPAEMRARLVLAYQNREVESKLILAKPRNPRHHISWSASAGKWLVRIKRNKRKIINRHFTRLEDAIAARDLTLATGQAPPAKRTGRPRGSFKRVPA